MPLAPETSPQRRRAIPIIAAGLALLILTPLILLLPSAISWDMRMKLRAGRYQLYAGRDAYRDRNDDFAQLDYYGPDFLNAENSDDHQWYLSLGPWTYKVLLNINKRRDQSSTRGSRGVNSHRGQILCPFSWKSRIDCSNSFICLRPIWNKKSGS